MMASVRRPCHIDFTHALKRYLNVGNTERAVVVAQYVVKNFSKFSRPDIFFANYVLSAFCRHKMATEAEQWFETLRQQFGENPEAYSLMIVMYQGITIP